jgi:hypothetical protein
LIAKIPEEIAIYNLLGTKLFATQLNVGPNAIHNQVSAGVYILTYGNKRRTIFLE